MSGVKKNAPDSDLSDTYHAIVAAWLECFDVEQVAEKFDMTVTAVNRILQKRHVRLRIWEELRKRIDEVGYDRDWVVAKYAHIAERALQLKPGPDGEIDPKVNYRVALEALQKLGEAFNIWGEAVLPGLSSDAPGRIIQGESWTRIRARIGRREEV